jgi:hypothetical protein
MRQCQLQRSRSRAEPPSATTRPKRKRLPEKLVNETAAPCAERHMNGQFLRRADVRARSRPATLARATRSRSTTAPKSVNRAVRTSPTIASARGTAEASLRSTSFEDLIFDAAGDRADICARLVNVDRLWTRAETLPVMRGPGREHGIKLARNPGGDTDVKTQIPLASHPQPDKPLPPSSIGV